MNTWILILIVAMAIIVAMANWEYKKSEKPSEVVSVQESPEERLDTDNSKQDQEKKETKKEEISENDKSEFIFYVKGIEYRKDDQIERAKKLNIGEGVNLVPQPNNRYDHNAIMVITKDKYLIGYVPKKEAAKMKNIFETNENNIVIKNYEYDGQVKIVIKSTFNCASDYDNEEIISYRYRTEIAPQKYEWWTESFMMSYLVNPKEFLEKITEKYKEDPEDLFIAFNYLKAVDRNKEGEEVIELAMMIGQKFDILETEEIKNIIKQQKINQKYIEAARQREESSEQYKKAREMLENKEYEKALPIFMDVMNSYYKIQATPKNICKCYIALEKYDILDEFIRQAINEKWLTESTKKQLIKYKEKYCRS